MKKLLAVALPVFGLAGALVAACKPATPTYMSRAALLDPATCQPCHAQHVKDWSGSMHAYASDDPVFVAMNARGQRETGGQLGSFCVKCHAPMAVRENATTDGLNLSSVPSKLKGINCYFCHTIDSVSDTHNAPVHLTGDVNMRGEIGDPFANTAHPSTHSNLQDRTYLESSNLCGSCHDIVNGHGANIERTFAEWKGTVFANATVGDTCGECHMNQSTSLQQIATIPGAPAGRRYHSHALVGVDTALVTFPETDAQKQGIQAQLDATLQSALCVGSPGFGVDAILDNVAAGHGVPSGASQDRRMWVEVIAYNAGTPIYQSGVVPADTAVLTPADPDLWLMRDCMLDQQSKPVEMFWEAFDTESTQLPGPTTLDPMMPAFYQTHVYRSYPRTGAGPMTSPDRVTMRVLFRPIDFDIVDSLIASKDLDPSLRPTLGTFQLGQTLEWTTGAGTMSYVRNGVAYSCVTNTNYNFQADKVAAPTPAHCTP